MKDVIIDYLKTMKLNVSKNYIERLLLSHPDYPSILSASDVIEQLGLNVQVGKIDEKDLPGVPFPYLVHTQGNNSFLLIEDEQSLTAKLKELNAWEGIILKAENRDQLSNPENEKAYKEDKFITGVKGAALLALGILIIVSVVPVINIGSGMFLLTALSGLVLGYILIAKDVGVKYAAVESFCGAGAANQCDKVLSSEYSNLFGPVSFSDVVLSYFAMQTMIAAFIIPASSNSSAWWTLLAVFAVLSIPAIIYSVYYQWAKIKAWCRLCLLVVGVLMLQIGFFTYAFQSSSVVLSNPGPLTIVSSALLFLTIGSAAVWVKTTIKDQNKTKQSEAAAKRVKYDPKVFTQYLLEHRKVEIKPLKHEISMGNPEAELQLVMASNLFCNPCKDMHEKLNALLQVWPDSLHISFRFLPVNMKDENETNPRDHLVHYWLQNIHGSAEESSQTQKIIHDWFNREGIEEFFSEHELRPESHADLTKVLEQQDNWVKEAKITKTPTLFLNGFEFPMQYTVKDLTSVIPGLMDHLKHEEKLKIKRQEKHVQEIV